MGGLLRRKRARGSASDVAEPDLSSLRRAALAHEQGASIGEAIAAWTEIVRQQPDPAIEEHLVDLRCDQRLNPPAGRGVEPWPRPLPDPFPDVHGAPPVIDAAHLTMEVLGGAILHHGCLLVRDLLPSAGIAPLRDTIDRALAGRQAHLGGASVDETTPWYRPCARWDEQTPDKARKARRYTDRGGSAVHLCDSPRAVLEVVEILVGSGVHAVVSDYLGERAVISANKSMLRRVPPDASPSWHQDGSFMGVRTRAVNAWISLSDCGEGRPAPGLAVLPQRVDVSVRGEVHDGDIVFTPAQLEATAGGAAVVRPTFAPGDALLFDELLVHANGGGAGGFTDQRYAIEAWMFAPSHLPTDYVPIAVG